MFSYIRWFSAITFILVVCAALFVGHQFKDIAAKELIDVVGNNNESLAQGFINTTWQDHGKEWQNGTDLYTRFRSLHVDVEIWKNPQYADYYKNMIASFDTFSKAVFSHFENMPIVGVRIYTPDGIQVISTDQSRIISAQDNTSLLSNTPPQAQQDEGFTQALSGASWSAMLEDEQFVKPNGDPDKGALVRSLIPILKNTNFVPDLVECTKGGKTGVSCMEERAKLNKNDIAAVIEIRYDVKSQWQKVNEFQFLGIVGVIGIFSIVLLTLLSTSYRAENIIARQHETNLELTAQAASAQAENREKSQFLANVSHELRTPLNAIIGFSEFIKSERSGPIVNEKYAEYIRDIHSSGVHLLSLINDILDFSKAEADKLELEISEVDASKSVKNSMRLMGPRAESAQVQLVEAIPREHFILQTDAKKLKQVMLNLLSNAVKFTPAGGSVKVSMWLNVVDGSLAIEVKDTGIGIAPKDISRAMAPFGQVDNALSRKYEGTGLGLPLTRKFVELMGGTFNIHSEVGKGTTITIALPKKSEGKEVQLEPTDQAKKTEAALITESNTHT